MMNTAASSDDFRRIEEKITDLAVQVQEVKGLIMPRADIEHALAQRVSMDAHQSVEMRLSRLEQSPQKNMAWVAVITSGAIGCLTLVVMGLGVAVAIGSMIITLVR